MEKSGLLISPNTSNPWQVCQQRKEDGPITRRHSLQTILLTHGLGAEVGVAARTIPVPRNGLRIKGCYHSKVFTYTVQDEAGHPEMISHVDSFAGSYLEFPLERTTWLAFKNNANFLPQVTSSKPCSFLTSIPTHLSSG